MQEILTALCLVLVIEGILPFLMPARWQRMLGGIAELGVRQIRLAGLASMLIGTLFTLVLLPAIYALIASDHPAESEHVSQTDTNALTAAH